MSGTNNVHPLYAHDRSNDGGWGGDGGSGGPPNMEERLRQAELTLTSIQSNYATSQQVESVKADVQSVKTELQTELKDQTWRLVTAVLAANSVMVLAFGVIVNMVSS